MDRQSVEARLRALEDRAEISELRALYCYHGDRSRWDELTDLFTEDAWFHGRTQLQGRAAIHEYFATAPRRRDAAWHFVHNETLELDGDSATGHCYFDAPTVVDGVAWVCAGYYDDAFRRVDGRWRFAGRAQHFLYMGPLDPGWQVDGVPAGLPR